MWQHVLPVRVYYDDTDASGLVHHSNYLKFFERGRTEALREQGFNLVDLYQNHGLQFVVHSATLEFLKSARLDQLLYIITMVESVRQASILYHQRMHLDFPDGIILCKAKLRLACINNAHKPCAVPAFLSMEMQK